MQDLSKTLKALVAGETLSEEKAAEVFHIIMTGEADEFQIASLLTALQMRGPTVAEVAGAASAMRATMVHVKAPEGALDLVGTGGDGHGTLNISSGASFVAAACGVPVAKHGNRNMTSKSGAADVLEALGVKIAMGPQHAEDCIEKAGITFLFAHTFHPAMVHVSPVRKALGFRTIYNLLGPLANPAGAKRQVLGVFGPEWLVPVAQTLQTLGGEKAWVVHGSDGMDEITTTGPTKVAAFTAGGAVTEFDVTPEEVGLPRAKLEDLMGGDAAYNARALTDMLEGKKSPYRDVVLMNAGAAIFVADKAASFADGVKMAASAIDCGAAMKVLLQLIEVSNA